MSNCLNFIIKKMLIIGCCILVAQASGIVYAATADNNKLYLYIGRYIMTENPSISPSQAITLSDDIIAAANQYRIDPLLLTALFAQESAFNQQAVSAVGAIGVAQLMPETAAYLGVDGYITRDNIAGGAHYLSEQMRKFADYGQWQLLYAVAAYNAGPGAVVASGGIPLYRETINHVRLVGERYRQLLQEYGNVN